MMTDPDDLAEHRMDAVMRAQIATDPEAGSPRDPSLPTVEHDDPSQPAPELAQALAASLVTLRLSREVAQVLCTVADERYEELRAYEGEIDNGENYRLLGLALNALDAAGVRVEHRPPTGQGWSPRRNPRAAPPEATTNPHHSPLTAPQAAPSH